MASSHITSQQIDGKTAAYFISLGSKNHYVQWLQPWNLKKKKKKSLLLGSKTMIHLDSIWKSRDISLQTNVHIVKTIVFPVVMYGCECCTKNKGEWWRSDAFKLSCWRSLLRVFWIAEIEPLYPIGNWPWIFTGRIYDEAEAPILWLPDVKNKFHGKDLGAGKDWRQKKKGETQDEMAR